MKQKNIGEYIAKLRKENNLTQQQLAEKIYVTRQAISKWEQGRSYPDGESLERLSQIFDVPIGEFIFNVYQIEEQNQDKDFDELSHDLQTNVETSSTNVDDVNQEQLLSFNDFITNPIIIKLYNSYNEYFIKSKRRLYTIIIIIIMFILSIILLVTIHLYNSVSVYNIHGENSAFALTDGMVFLTSENYYIQIGKFISKKDDEIKELELYYYNEDKERITMFKTYNYDNAGIFLRDYLGYNAYFNLNQFDALLNTLSIDYVLEDDTRETLTLRLEKEKLIRYLEDLKLLK